MTNKITDLGQQLVSTLAARTGFSGEAVTHMLIAVHNGNGTMAQFSHPEFGGSGQWMRGGMVMLGDLFNNQLKSRVDALANEIANAIAGTPGDTHSGSSQSQWQGEGPLVKPFSSSPFFNVEAASNWYPAELGTPSSSGSQNTTKYAYFADKRRLAVDTNGDVWVYDTLDHQISGFSQQQGGVAKLGFTSQHGLVDLKTLPVVSHLPIRE